MSPPVADGHLAEAIRPARSAVRAIPIGYLEPEHQPDVPRAIAIAALLSVPFWLLFGFAVYLIW
jgi:hypothetical protein